MSPSSAHRRVEVDRRGRFYELEDGERYPSVTNILGVINKPALVNWAASQERDLVIRAASALYEDLPAAPKMSRAAYAATLQKRLGHEKAHTKELAKACEIGSQAHELIEWNLRKELGQRVGPHPQIGDKALWAFMAYEDWRKSVGLKPVMIEQTLWSRTHRYAGTMDLCADVGTLGSLAVIDFKTSKRIYEEALLQVAAYVEALCEMGHGNRGQIFGVILRLPKVESDPGFEARIITPEEMEPLFKAFMHTRALWSFTQEHNDWMRAATQAVA